MKIVVVGLGKTGTGLIKNLSAENYDIVGVDTDGARVQDVIEKYDVNGVVGNGCLPEILEEAGAKDADLLIAVTPGDERNILCCLVGKSLGTRHLIAQIRSPEYYTNFELLGEKFGVNRFFNLESVLSSRITRVLKAPASVNLSSFGGGRLEIAEFPVPEKSKAVGKRIADLKTARKKDFLIVAVERDDGVVVPNGDTVIEEGDVLNVCAGHRELRDVLGYFGVEKRKIESVMILGAEETTYFLASELLDEGLAVKVIGKERDKCERLKERLGALNVVCDDYNNKEVLMREGIEETDALVAMAPSDENNIVASLFARTHSISKVVTVVGSDLYREMLEDISLNLVYSPYELAGASIATYVRSINVPEDSQIVSMQKIAGGEAEALQFNIGKNPAFVGKKVVELSKKMKSGVLICAVVRGRSPVIPNGETELEEGDDIVVVSLKKRITKLEDILK